MPPPAIKTFSEDIGRASTLIEHADVLPTDTVVLGQYGMFLETFDSSWNKQMVTSTSSSNIGYVMWSAFRQRLPCKLVIDLTMKTFIHDWRAKLLLPIAPLV